MIETQPRLLETCPYCHHKRAELFRPNQALRHGNGHRDFYKCVECGMVYPRPRGLEVSGDSPRFQDPLVKDAGARYLTKLFRRLKGTYGTKKALDIGANTGKLCYIWSQLGIDAVGLEAGKEFVTYAQSKGIRCYQAAFPEIPSELSGHQFDLISCNSTEFYFLDPKSCFEKIYALLNEGGIFFLKFNSIDSHDYAGSKSLFERAGNSVQGFASIESVTYNLKKTGFKIAETIPYPEDYFYQTFKLRLKIIQGIFNRIYYTVINHKRLLKTADYVVVIAQR